MSKTQNINRYRNIDGIRVRELAGGSWLLVEDPASRYFVSTEEFGSEDTTYAFNAYDADRSAVDDIADNASFIDWDRAEDRRDNAYSILCQFIDTLHDDDVPASVRTEARVLLGLDADESICYGW